MSIDTSTTSGKIQVMQAFEDGGKLECDFRYNHDWRECVSDSWCWNEYNYRIKPQTVEDAAVEFADKYTGLTAKEGSLVRESFRYAVGWKEDQDNE